MLWGELWGVWRSLGEFWETLCITRIPGTLSGTNAKLRHFMFDQACTMLALTQVASLNRFYSIARSSSERIQANIPKQHTKTRVEKTGWVHMAPHLGDRRIHVLYVAQIPSLNAPRAAVLQNPWPLSFQGLPPPSRLPSHPPMYPQTHSSQDCCQSVQNNFSHAYQGLLLR